MGRNNENVEIVLSRYERIALDLAYEIYNQKFEEGYMIRGRSTLAGRYNVSSETVRRAIKLLEEMKVLESIDKVGVLIKSRENAHRFIQEYQTKNKILALRESIAKISEERERLNHMISEQVDLIIEQSLTLRNIGIIYPLEYRILSSSHLINKTIGGSRFWENTGATIIGVNRDGNLELSPGPKFSFREDDIIVYVGNVVNITEKVENFANRES